MRPCPAKLSCPLDGLQHDSMVWWYRWALQLVSDRAGVEGAQLATAIFASCAPSISLDVSCAEARARKVALKSVQVA